jgi:hypothetical protein
MAASCASLPLANDCPDIRRFTALGCRLCVLGTGQRLPVAGRCVYLERPARGNLWLATAMVEPVDRVEVAEAHGNLCLATDPLKLHYLNCEAKYRGLR